MSRYLLPLLLLSPAVFGQDWSLRSTRFANITAEQIADGIVPGWHFEIGEEDGAEVISITGDDEAGGNFIGQVYLGRPLDLGDEPVRTLLVRGQLQVDCETINRTPAISVMLLSPAGWERLATDPALAEPPPAWGAGEMLGQAAIEHPENAVEWIEFQSNNLAPRLARAKTNQVMLVLYFSGNHAGSVEYAKFKNLEVIVSDALPPVPERELQWPLKTARTLHSDDEVALARQRIDDDENAAKLRDRYVNASQMWLEVPDEDLSWRLPDASVPRAFNTSVAGCPVHGKEIFKHGTYPWKLSFDKPFQIECPVGGEMYPSNDFLKYYQSGYQDKSALAGEYSDDGWGWIPADGERRWLVAYANHWFWSRYNIPGALNLSRAYLLTGDPTYAHKAAAMLARIADIYPAMDYQSQSRYGFLNPGYDGKILNLIWETGTIRNLAEAYDNVWETIDGDTALQQLRQQSGEEIRRTIETNLLEEGIDRIADGTIHGNFGMHQSALATVVAVRQNAPSEQLLATILDTTGSEARDEGILYALYNWVHRDGVPYETSPGYNFGWVGNLTETALLLEKAGTDLYELPQFRRLLQWPIDLTVNGQHTPALGDAGNIQHGKSGRSYDVYREAFQRYGGADFAWMFEQSGGQRSSYGTYDSLFLEPLVDELQETLADQPRPAPTSRVLDGYGMVLLNNPADTVGVMNYYGWRGGHSHRDGLTFDLYAHGKAVTPDTGYPDFMNAYVPGIYSWSKATIAHNTVTVDAKQQTGNAGGQVHRFASSPQLQYSDVSAPGNYPGIGEYRRALLLVGTDEENGYLVDIFRVAGGSQHDYSLHGTVGQRDIVAGSFTAPQTQGTLAGEDVEVGQLYDHEQMGTPGYQGGYGGYYGSGFQHLINVQRQEGDGPVVIEVTPATEPLVKLRMHVLPQPSQRVILAEAQISPVKQMELLPYLLARRTGDNLSSTFVTVLDPFTGTPRVQQVERLVTADDAVAVRIARADGTDVILQARQGGAARAAGDLFTTDAALAVVRLDAAGQPVWLQAVGGTWLELGGTRHELNPAVGGTITGLDLDANTVTVEWADPAPAPESLLGQEIFLGNDQRDNVYRVTGAEATAAGMVLALREDLKNGRARVLELDDATKVVKTDSRMLFQAIYPGMRVANEAGTQFTPITSAGGGTFQLATEQPLVFDDDNGNGKSEFWVTVVGPGDRARFEPVTVIEW